MKHKKIRDAGYRIKKTMPVLQKTGMCRLLIIPVIVFFAIWIPDQVISQNRPMNAASIESLKNHVKEIAGSTQSIVSDFTQEKEMSMIKEPST